MTKDKYVIYNALRMWKNYIETGDVNISTQDHDGENRKFKKLTPHQIDFIRRLDDLSIKILNDRWVPESQP